MGPKSQNGELETYIVACLNPYGNLSNCQIFHFRWKNTLHLKSRHIIALSLKETKKKEAKLELHIVNSKEQQSSLHSNWAKILWQSQTMWDQKTVSFERFPKFWHEPILHLGMYASHDRRSQQKDAGKCNQSCRYDNAIMLREHAKRKRKRKKKKDFNGLFNSLPSRRLQGRRWEVHLCYYLVVS